jgi:hypothetical protein
MIACRACGSHRLDTVIDFGPQLDMPDLWLNLSEPNYTLWEEHVNYFTLKSLGRYLFAVSN